MSVPAVARAVALLELLAAQPGEPRTLSELSRALDAPKSSTSALCAELEAAGYVEKVDGGMRLGRATVALGGAYVRQFEPAREFAAACRRDPVLREEVVQLAVLDEMITAGRRVPAVLYVARHEGTAPLRVSASVGDRLPATTTAVGQVMLASLDDAGRAAAVRAVAEASGGSVVERILEEELERTRERGYGVDDGRTFDHVVGIAVAVPGARGARPCAVGVSMLDSYADADRRQAVGESLRWLAQRLRDPAPELAGTAAG
ncbi:IclR family transcriptional regulator [Flavimobilis soli]|uniref:IclR family transcriptional regulator n=1 Tax=Flavimobilis soli TaxID=442709 RepID=A0A2A9EE94_9MICO|nr:IclR family transcriptional regulator C-terminal domain-containing protein [Flavimobilis soli]PFG36582.1 IclR family transcriptional regulator [Flavimobilis soli]